MASSFSPISQFGLVKKDQTSHEQHYLTLHLVDQNKNIRFGYEENTLIKDIINNDYINPHSENLGVFLNANTEGDPLPPELAVSGVADRNLCIARVLLTFSFFF